MNVQFGSGFLRDLNKLKRAAELPRIRAAIETLRVATTLQQVPNVKPMRGVPNYYRIRIGEYRMGFKS